MKVMIVDDHPLFREAVKMAISGLEPKEKSIVEAGSLQEAVTQIGQARPNLILLDMVMDDAKGLSGLTRIRDLAPDSKIVIVSANDNAITIQSAATLGADGFVSKNADITTLREQISRALQGEKVFPNTEPTGSNAASRVADLTPAQRRVMGHLSTGLVNKQIAHEMGISEATVKAHMTAILRKLGATNRTQALLVYREAVSGG